MADVRRDRIDMALEVVGAALVAAMLVAVAVLADDGVALLQAQGWLPSPPDYMMWM
jgi:hypothetical protein